jgi:hypothetical protein
VNRPADLIGVRAGLVRGDALTFAEWLALGITNGWVSDVTCVQHNGLPMTDEEMSENEDWDICLPGLRVWDAALAEPGDD